MTKRILIVGKGQDSRQIADKTKNIDMKILFVDHINNSSYTDLNAESAPADLPDLCSIIESARLLKADGIYCASPNAERAVVQSAAELALPGMSPKLYETIQSRTAINRILADKGVPCAEFKSAKSFGKAQAILREIEMPSLIMADKGSRREIICRIDHAEDLPLAFSRVAKASESKNVLIGGPPNASFFSAYGLVHEGQYFPCGVAQHTYSSSLYRTLLGIHTPPSTELPPQCKLQELAAATIEALNMNIGSVCIEFAADENDAVVMDVSVSANHTLLHHELLSHAYGMNIIGDCLRLAIGEKPKRKPIHQKACAIYTLDASTGVVEEVNGVEEASKIPNVECIVCKVKPGDLIRHAVDPNIMTSPGHVIAAAPTVKEAISAAKQARAICKITATAYSRNDEDTL